MVSVATATDHNTSDMNNKQTGSISGSIKLISAYNNHYQLFLNKFKTKKDPGKVIFRTGNKKSATMGYLLELTIQEWTKMSKSYNENRIISYRTNGSYRVCYREMDYVLKQGKTISIGEVKTSTTESGLVEEACKQLISARDLILQISPMVEMQIIRIDLNTSVSVDKFDECFDNMKFRDYVWNGYHFKIIHLSAKDVFDFGVSRNIILSPELFLTTMKEVNIIANKRDLATRLKHKLDNGLDDDEKKKLELQIQLVNNKLELSQDGYTILDGNNTCRFIELIGQPEAIKKYNYYAQPCDCFQSIEPIYKYLAINANADLIVHLLNSEQTYMRIPREKALLLTELKFESQKSGSSIAYPMYTRTPERKFYIPRNKHYQNGNYCDALNDFFDVLANSEPYEINLRAGQMLVINNYIIVHKICHRLIDDFNTLAIVEEGEVLS